MPDPFTTYLSARSPEAFAQVVHQHADLVYSAARRQLADSQLAEDVTQAVFLLLQRKAPHVRGPLSGWLMQATFYACRNARKLAARRQFHERRAAQMTTPYTPSAAEPHSPWETYAPFLDAALMRLSPLDRNALTLRYFQNLPLRQVGAALNLSEDAARKRVDRALLKLRALLTKQASTPAAIPTPTLLAPALLAHGIQSAPAHLLTTLLTSGITTTSTASTLTLLTKGVTQAMLWAKLKLAALIGIIATAAAFGTTIVILQAPSPTPDPTLARLVSSAPSVNPPTSAPATTLTSSSPRVSEPKQIQIVRWGVLLDAPAAEAVKKVAKPLATTSKGYQAYRISASDLRKSGQQVLAEGNVVRTSHHLLFAWEVNVSAEGDVVRIMPDLDSLSPGKVREGHDALQLLWPCTLYYHDVRAPEVDGMGEAISSGPTVFDRPTSDTLHLTLNCTGVSLQLSDSNQPPTIKKYPDNSVNYDGVLPADEAVIFMGEFTAPSGEPCYNLIAFETFMAAPASMPYISQQKDSHWWWLNGPQRMEQFANTTRLWATQATHPVDQVPPAFVIKLEDGNLFRLTALSDSRKWPACYWDASGLPINYESIPSFYGDPIPGEKASAPMGPAGQWVSSEPVPGLVAILQTSSNRSAEDPTAKTTPGKNNNCTIGTGIPLKNDAEEFSVGVLVGPWKEVTRLELNTPTTVADTTYLVEAPQEPINERYHTIIFTKTGMFDDAEDCLVIGQKNDKEQLFESPDTFLFQRTPEVRTVRHPRGFLDLPQANVAYYKVMRRKRQWVSFKNFATTPQVEPRTDVTGNEAYEAEQKIQAQKHHAQEMAFLDTRNQQHQKWNTIPADPTTPMGLTRLLYQALKAQDKAQARQLMGVFKPKDQPDLDAIVDLALTRQKLFDLSITRFGAFAVLSEFPGNGIEDFESYDMNNSWTKDTDGTYYLTKEYSTALVIRPLPNGHLYFDYTPTMKRPQDILDVKKTLQMAQKRLQILEQNPTITLPQFIELLHAPPTTAPTTTPANPQ